MPCMLEAMTVSPLSVLFIARFFTFVSTDFGNELNDL